MRNPGFRDHEVMEQSSSCYILGVMGVISISSLQMGKLNSVKETDLPKIQKNATSKNEYHGSFPFHATFSGPDGNHYLNFLPPLISSLQTKRKQV